MVSLLLLAASFATPPLPDAVVRLTVRPAAAPKPALKYQLLPEVRELTTGNPAQWYLRCFAEQRNFFFGKEGVAQRVRYQRMTLAELPGKELKNFGGSALTQADWAARLDTVDWQALDRVKTEGADLAQPELSALRLLGESLQIRFRGEIARKDFDAAIRTAKTMFAFARHLGEHTTSAGNLLGLAVADMALNTLEEMIAQPGCPNLYWALTDLPCPLVDLRKGFQGDRTLADNDLKGLRGDAAMTEAELEELVGRLSGRSGFARLQAGLPPHNLRADLAAQAKDADRLLAARIRLALAGSAEKLVEKLPPLQVILLDARREYESRRDDELKLLGLAPFEIDALGVKKAEGCEPFADLVPRIAEARRAQARVEQRIGLLRHVEALRMYAADHEGKLPATLADLKLPLPTDPFTGKPFAYKLDGGTATLTAGGPKGEEQNPAFNRRYEIIVRKDER
jgi:hypothetical protein